MEKFRIKRTDDKDLSFTGKLIATAFTATDRAHEKFSGDTGRATTINLYQTKAGKYIVETEHITQWAGEEDSTHVEILETKEDVFNYLENGKLAKEIYEEWGQSPVEDIE